MSTDKLIDSDLTRADLVCLLRKAQAERDALLTRALNAEAAQFAAEAETIAVADLAAHWAKVAPAPVAGEHLSIELKVLPEAMQALKEATVQATAAIKRAKSAQAELVRMIEVFGASIAAGRRR